MTAAKKPPAKPVYSETIEAPEDLEAIADARAELGLPPQELTSTVLRMWQEVLSNIEFHDEQKISIDFAARVVARYSHLGVRVQEVREYYTIHNTYLKVFRKIVLDEIESDPACLEHVEDDGEYNAPHYLNILLQWQLQIRQFEQEWESNTKIAHLRLAAFNDAIAFILGAEALASLLDHNGFEMTDDDREYLAAALEEA
jgi:hypothetical protein